MLQKWVGPRTDPIVSAYVAGPDDDGESDSDHVVVRHREDDGGYGHHQS